MEQKEVEILVDELETRVERLRALYEQYFMGIEKVEPAVPRKDVERRLYVLRRTQIRNTAIRFRFQNALLRFNTYQTYWMRICRQIEEGTYKRDIRRANARFAAKPKDASSDSPGSERDAHDTDPPQSAGAKEVDLDEGEDVELDFDGDADSANPHDASWLEDLQMKAVLRPNAVPKELQATPPGRPPLETLPEVWVGKSAARRPSKEPAGPPKLSPAVVPPPRGAVPAQPPAQPAGQPQAGGLRYAQPGRPRRPSEIPIPGRVAKALPIPAAPPARPARPPSVAPPKRKSRPSMPRVEAPKVPRPTTSRPVAQPAKAAAAPKPVRDGNLSDERVRQIYTQYVDTKRSLKESTASLTYESLSKSLRDSSDKLRQKHTGKSVDFEVTVKDGKTILRPVVK